MVFNVEGKMLGTGMVEKQFHPRIGVMEKVMGHAFICPTCAEVWARFDVKGSDYLVHRSPCSRHPISFFMPAGSVWLPLETEVIKAMPRSVLEYEFHCQVANVEKFGA